jgi:carbonic anhydrase
LFNNRSKIRKSTVKNDEEEDEDQKGEEQEDEQEDDQEKANEEENDVLEQLDVVIHQPKLPKRLRVKSNSYLYQ